MNFNSTNKFQRINSVPQLWILYNLHERKNSEIYMIAIYKCGITSTDEGFALSGKTKK